VRDDGTTSDPFDELFEPFELDELPPADEPPPRRAAAPPPTAATVPAAATGTAGVTCPSCGSTNALQNQHCDQCGARLGRDPLPVATPPAGGSSPGLRAIGVLAAVVLVVFLGALTLNALRGGAPADAEEATATSSTTTTQPPIVTELFPSSVEASSELASLPASNLIDGDPGTYWNDESLQGVDASLTFRFSRAVQIREIEIQNLTDDEKFKRNYRIKGYVITVDDLNTEIAGRLEDTNEPQRVKIASLDTTKLTIQVTSTYPAQAIGDAPAYSELALQGVRFFGVER